LHASEDISARQGNHRPPRSRVSLRVKVVGHTSRVQNTPNKYRHRSDGVLSGEGLA